MAHMGANNDELLVQVTTKGIASTTAVLCSSQ